MIATQKRVNHEGLGFNGINEKAMNNKITFVKKIDMLELSFSSKERAVVKEEGRTLPLHTSYGRLHKGSDKGSSETKYTPTLGIINKSINQKKNKKSERYGSSKTLFVCHCCKIKGHINTIW
jgi:hypothetical protein